MPRRATTGPSSRETAAADAKQRGLGRLATLPPDCFAVLFAFLPFAEVAQFRRNSRVSADVVSRVGGDAAIDRLFQHLHDEVNATGRGSPVVDCGRWSDGVFGHGTGAAERLGLFLKSIKAATPADPMGLVRGLIGGAFNCVSVALPRSLEGVVKKWLREGAKVPHPGDPVAIANAKVSSDGAAVAMGLDAASTLPEPLALLAAAVSGTTILCPADLVQQQPGPSAGGAGAPPTLSSSSSVRGRRPRKQQQQAGDAAAAAPNGSDDDERDHQDDATSTADMAFAAIANAFDAKGGNGDFVCGRTVVSLAYTGRSYSDTPSEGKGFSCVITGVDGVNKAMPPRAHVRVENYRSKSQKRTAAHVLPASGASSVDLSRVPAAMAKLFKLGTQTVLSVDWPITTSALQLSGDPSIVGRDALDLRHLQRLTTLDKNFGGGLQVTRLHLPVTPLHLKQQVFHSCPNLTVIDWSTMTELVPDGPMLLARCNGLRRLVLPRNWSRIPSLMCQDCQALEDVPLAHMTRLLTVESGAFQRCQRLHRLELPATVTAYRAACAATHLVVDATRCSQGLVVFTGSKTMQGVEVLIAAGRLVDPNAKHGVNDSVFKTPSMDNHVDCGGLTIVCEDVSLRVTLPYIAYDNLYENDYPDRFNHNDYM